MTRVTLVSTVKDEAPWLLEWLAYHRSIGITDICIFSNDCSDGTNLILNRLDQMGELRHFDNPLGPRMDPQRAAYSRAGRMDWVRSSDWVLIVDADEFLNVKVGDGSVGALLAACAPADAISVNWRIMGSGGAREMSADPVTERFTRGSSFDAPENGLVWGFKTLFRPGKFDYFGVHRPKFRPETDPPPIRWVNGDGREITERVLRKGWRSNRDTLGHGLAQVNHYAVKSRQEFLLKRLRGTANSKNKDRIDEGYWEKFDLNGQSDRTIRAGGVEPILSAWLADPDLAALVRAAEEATRRSLARLMEAEHARAFVAAGPSRGAAE